MLSVWNLMDLGADYMIIFNSNFKGIELWVLDYISSVQDRVL
jgi:hypothetical protein